MAKKRAEDAPPSLLWKDTFSDLMNLLLCFFVLLFSMSTVDADKFQELAASLASAFSVLPSGGSTIKSDGILVGSGASQLNELSDYYNNMKRMKKYRKKGLSSLKRWQIPYRRHWICLM